MNDIYLLRLKRILGCHVQALTAEQAKELTDLIKEKVDAGKAKAQSDRGKRDSGAAA